jgi:hypothetical protein
MPTPTGAAAQAGAIHVKFRDGTGVRLRAGELVSTSAQLGRLRRALEGVGGLRIERLFSTPEQALTRHRSRIEARSGRKQPNLNLYFRLSFDGPGGGSLVATLENLDVVERAYPEPRPAPPPATPSFVALQGYRAPAPKGIDAAWAAATAAGLGGGVRIADIEYDWNLQHEDLDRVRSRALRIDNRFACNPFGADHHGTAVLGELAADRDASGVTGLVPRVAVTLVNSAVERAGACVWNLADAVDLAHHALDRGDVLVIEQQARSSSGFVPVEWIPAVYDAILSATSDGIIVIEPAGNGGADLDASEFGTPFPRGLSDSGAIVVGAAGAPGCKAWPGGPRARLGFSSYGTRVDLQGWGECVATTGYGDLYGTTTTNLYTDTFGGTSAAAAMAAAASAALSSVTEARTGQRLTSQEARFLLRATGTPQDLSTPGQIGPLPDLRAALGAGALSR